MRMTRSEFIAWPNKAITLMGMSGVGKTTLAYKLPKSTWFHFSGDYRIGTKYLAEPILDNIKQQAMQVDFLRDLLRSDSIYIDSNITVHNLESIATFLGKIGRNDQGGLSVNEFNRRQNLHRTAEIGAMRDVVEFIEKASQIYGYDHFINDAGGSICELDDDETMQILAKHTLILYLRADKDLEKTLIQRALDNPKPMYYQAQFLRENLDEYLKVDGLASADDIVPDQFASWVFPRLVEHRKPKYQKLADTYGYTVDARLIAEANDETDFLGLVAGTLEQG